MRSLRDRLSRLERASTEQRGETQCDACRSWTPVCVQRVDVDGTETWETEQPRECPRCGWVAHVVVFTIVADWRSVTAPRRGR